MEIVNDILESIRKCFFFFFKLNLFFGTSAKVLVLFEDERYYKHILAFSVVRNMV